MEKRIVADMPYDSQDYETMGWEYTIPEGMEAEIKDGKIIVRQQETDDEKIRKGLVALIDNWSFPQELFTTKKRILAYLDRQKELFESGSGLYYYDGEKLYFIGNPAMEDSPYDFAMNQQEEEKEQKQRVKDPFDDEEFRRGYEAGKNAARKEAEKSYGFQYPYYEPPCFHGGICTNPYKDCINCPRTGGDIGISTTSGTYKKD